MVILEVYFLIIPCILHSCEMWSAGNILSSYGAKIDHQKLCLTLVKNYWNLVNEIHLSAHHTQTNQMSHSKG
jgi:hypothetical protein